MNVTGYKKWVIFGFMLLGLAKMLHYQFGYLFTPERDPHTEQVIEELHRLPDARPCVKDADCTIIPLSCRRCHCPDEQTLRDMRRDNIVCKLTSEQHTLCQSSCTLESTCVKGKCEIKKRE